MSESSVPSITTPGIGGVESTTTPSDVDDEHISAVLHAVTVT